MKGLILTLAFLIPLSSAQAVLWGPGDGGTPGMNACRPGDGPTPLIDLTDKVATKEQSVPLEGNLEEFLLWEKRGELLYRNSKNIISVHHLDSGLNEVVGQSPYPLLNMLEDQNRFALAGGGGLGWLFDKVAGGWFHFDSHARQLHPLFWKKNELYLIREQPLGRSQSVIYAFKYLPGQKYTMPVCPPITIRHPGTLRFAEGHRFPNAYFYVADPVPGQVNLAMLSIDLKTCRPGLLNEYPYVFYGPIQSVHVFDTIQSFAVKVAHEKYNLLWHSGYGCHYFDIHKRSPVFFENDQPFLLTRNSGKGLTFIDLRHGNKTALLTEVPAEELDESEVRVSSTGERVFVPRRRCDGTKGLVEISIDR